MTSMKAKLTSGLVGIAIGAALVFLMGAGGNPGQAGRYQIAGASGFFVVLDTETGRCWAANLAAPVPGFQGVQPGFWETKADR